MRRKIRTDSRAKVIPISVSLYPGRKHDFVQSAEVLKLDQKFILLTRV